MEKPGMADTSATSPASLTALVAAARRAPGRALAVLIGVHLLVWTALPILVCPNLQLDLVEDLAFGREWQLGYWKHPPLPWWTAELVVRLTGQTDVIYLLGPLAVVICFYAVWLLAREVAGAFQGLIAILILEGVHFYNFSAVKFAHDQMQLPFWAFTGWAFHRALTRRRALDWMIAGALLAGAFWSKYAAVALAATLILFLLIDPRARTAWRGPGPYLMAITFLIVLAPHLGWLLAHDLMPLHYVDERALPASGWMQAIGYPLQWVASQILFLTPALVLLALLALPLAARTDAATTTGRPSRVAPDHGFDRSYVTWLALGPFAITTLAAAVLGRLPVAMWGYSLWIFAPLAALIWLGPVAEARRLRRFAAAAIAVAVAFPLAYGLIELYEPLVRDRPKATQFPGRAMADIITREWRAAFGSPLLYVGGTEFAANNVAVYSTDRPHVVVHGDPKLSPWIDLTALRRHGAVLVWEEGLPGVDTERWLATFVTLEVQPVLVLARQTRQPVRPARIGFAFVPPDPRPGP
jgi:4-amino-4-deoxy-L-arabinose transferase-like glycosyltransferase